MLDCKGVHSVYICPAKMRKLNSIHTFTPGIQFFFSCEYASVDYCEIWNWEQENKVNNWGNNNAFSIWLWRFFFYNFLFTCSFIMYLLASKTLEATHSNLKLNFSCTLKRIQTLWVHIYPFVFNDFVIVLHWVFVYEFN